MDPLDAPLSIRCAVCNHEVDAVHRLFDSEREEVTYIVECHGERQESRLSVLEIVRSTRISVREAFAIKKLPEVHCAGPSHRLSK